MATINGVTLAGFNLRVVSIHRNEMIDIPGSDTNYITDMGYDGLVLRLEGFETTLAEYDAVIAEFMKPGDQTLVVRTGWQYSVHSVQLTPAMLDGFPDNYFPYDLMLITSTPYRESTAETTRSKTITTNNQEWSADDSANDIDTDGNVDAVPDIQVIGAYEEIEIEQTSHNINIGMTLSLGQTFTPTSRYITKIIIYAGWIQTGGDNITLRLYDGISKTTELASKTVSVTSVGEYTFEFDDVVDVDGLTPYIRFDLIAADKVQLYADSTNPYGGGRVYVNDNPLGYENNDLWFRIYGINDHIESPIIYNISDTTIKCNIGNQILSNAIHKINADGTGTINYDDNLSSKKYQIDSTNSGVSHDTTNDELDIADDGYIYWEIDTKYPITGIPTLTSQINNTAATLPTIQISDDGSTWYDIDTVVVDDVDTEYELDDTTNFSLKGLTLFYFRIDCVAAAVTQGCSVKSFELDIDIVTIDAEHPKITTGVAASTFRCDQHTDSGLNCTVALIFRDRSWAG